MVNKKTSGELVFEKYLNQQKLPFSYEQPIAGSSRLPDYAVPYNGSNLLFDVKDFDLATYGIGAGSGFGYRDTYGPIREKIETGRVKFKNLKTFCCSLVLYGGGTWLDLTAFAIYPAMLGDLGFQFPVNSVARSHEAISAMGMKLLLREIAMLSEWTDEV